MLIHVLPKVEDPNFSVAEGILSNKLFCWAHCAISKEKKPRSDSEMAKEAEELRKYFEQNNVADVMRW